MSVSVFEARRAEKVHIPLVEYRYIACKLLRGGAGNQIIKRVNLNNALLAKLVNMVIDLQRDEDTRASRAEEQA